MTRKKNSVKLNKLHLIKRRRMQKYHARKIIRAFAPYRSGRRYMDENHPTFPKQWTAWASQVGDS